MDEEKKTKTKTAYYHLPGLFEFYELYQVFLPLFREHREYFYDWCDIGSIYGAPTDCLWGGGRVEIGDRDPREILALMREYGISARLTFSNSLLREEHLSDRKCNDLCALLNVGEGIRNGVIVHSELLLEYLKKTYPGLYFVSSTTRVITDFQQFTGEVDREDFGIIEIQNIYLPMGFSNFKIEGRGLGSALILEFLLYYLTKPKYQLHVREEIYLDNMLDLF